MQGYYPIEMLSPPTTQDQGDVGVLFAFLAVVTLIASFWVIAAKKFLRSLSLLVFTSVGFLFGAYGLMPPLSEVGTPGSWFIGSFLFWLAMTLATISCSVVDEELRLQERGRHKRKR